MWYHSLKTRQVVKRVNTRNSHGSVVAFEYLDKKFEVHSLSKDASPLTFEDITSIVFIMAPESSLIVIAINLSTKGKFTYEFRAWEFTNNGVFIQQDIAVMDALGSCMNDGKSKALWSAPDISNPYSIRADALGNVLAAALGVRSIYIWKCLKVEHNCISCEFIVQVDSSMSAIDLILLQPSKDNLPYLVVGECGGIRTWTETDRTDERGETLKFEDTFYSVQSFDASSSLFTCHDFQRINKDACIFGNTAGNLYLFLSSRIINLKLPVSYSGHGSFAVENIEDKSSKALHIATV
ncbi:uncharacterized protein LOC124459646 [Xenia sp. Carnegie-2017]|uniref:uncharacterized protein LOC124459646 n=1 Tax=Xenia sp. Carnegie-2017 TaxID=2897299 RepID=UPI001F03D289|nr:uncharacterized protein LOC124459646 [Xenia sp. Carnegie-2017]